MSFPGRADVILGLTPGSRAPGNEAILNSREPVVMPFMNTIAAQNGTILWTPRYAGSPFAAFYSQDFFGASGTSYGGSFALYDNTPAGTPILDAVDGSINGIFRLQLAANNEAEQIGFYQGNNKRFELGKLQTISYRLLVAPDQTGLSGDLAAGDNIVFGIASDRNATLDNIATNAWFRLAGSMSLLLETDDGVTDNDDKPAVVGGLPVVLVTGTEAVFTIDFSNLSVVKFYVNGVLVNGANVFDMSAADGTEVQYFLEIQKAAAANNDHRVDVDYFELASLR
jgi:hypothetical protein